MEIACPGPAYAIYTRRLVVRCWNPADAPLIKAAIDASIEHLKPWMPWAAQEPQPLQAKIDLLRRFRSEFDAGRDYVYGVFSSDETLVIGGTGLHTRTGDRAREIGYWIRAECINQGFATEVAAALTKVAFEVDKVQRVEIHCDPANVRSAAVPRKLGYTLEATLRRRTRTTAGHPRDTMIWTLFDDEYPNSLAASAELQAFDAIGRRLV
jgi:RimJ/RimL family protein N-acetyltransferase